MSMTSPACGFARTRGPPRASWWRWYTCPVLLLMLLLLNRQHLLLNKQNMLCPQRRRRRRRLTIRKSEKSCNFENQNYLFKHMHTPCSGHTCLFLVGNKSGNVFYVSSIFNVVQMSHLVAWRKHVVHANYRQHRLVFVFANSLLPMAAIHWQWNGICCHMSVFDDVGIVSYIFSWALFKSLKKNPQPSASP